MSRPVRIGLDCDGVLYDQVDAFRWWIHHSTGRSLDELGPATAWHFYRDDWGYTLPEFLDMFTAGVRAGAIFGQGAPLPGTVRSLQRLREAGHRLIVVTNREIAGIDLAVTEQLTRTWLDTWQLPIDDLVISADKTVADVDLFLEDSIDNYDAIGRWRTVEAIKDGTGENPALDPSGVLPDGRAFADSVAASGAAAIFLVYFLLAGAA